MNPIEIQKIQIVDILTENCVLCNWIAPNTVVLIENNSQIFQIFNFPIVSANKGTKTQ